MSDLQEKKKQPSRYPLGTIKQARGTLARLTRDVLNNRIDIQKARAAAYVISQLIQLFRIEKPEERKVDISIREPEWMLNETPDERKSRLEELLKKAVPFYDDYLEYAKKREIEINTGNLKSREINSLDRRLDFEKDMSMISEVGGDDDFEKLLIAADNAADIADKNKQGLEPAESSAQVEDTGAQWKSCGIGVRR
jgi:hypothetical protein